MIVSDLACLIESVYALRLDVNSLQLKCRETMPSRRPVKRLGFRMAVLFGPSWDVNELTKGDIRKRIDSAPNFLRVGVCGLAGANLA